MKKIMFLLISLGLFFTTMLNFVYAVNDNESSIETIEQTNNINQNNDSKEKRVPSIFYNTHMQDYGWLDYVNDESISGVIDNSKRLEAIQISLNDNSYDGSIEYSTHVEDYGWFDYVSNGSISGTTGESRRLEAIKIRLRGEISEYYDVYYRVYCQNIGWLDWTSNGKVAGTIGGCYRLEAIQIKLSSKNDEKLEKTNKSSLTFSYKSGFKVCYDANGRLCKDLEGILGLQESYELRVNKETNVVTVLIPNGEGKHEIAYKRFICSVGDDTPIGVFYTPVKYRWRALVESSYGQYATRIVNRILFHSVPYDKKDSNTLFTEEYNKLGTTCSHGCIRLTCEDAKWIYDNCALKTKVEIVSEEFDPLSKPMIKKIPLNQTWDPTDSNI
ncbi:L,D-transpeptidase family protein [Thomasclavelia cocleata]|uniref:L,D-transpeptidase family protein n=1 Tax=Thomasclavelia cocleata TaxID=69824 RepID=UPI002557F9A7|nr:L,D-transpeptidase family protein [Thomasclavelia cocleata]